MAEASEEQSVGPAEAGAGAVEVAATVAASLAKIEKVVIACGAEAVAATKA